MTWYSSAPRRTEPAHPKPTQSRIYESLKNRIVRCELPPGETIYEDRVAEEFGTSRTPVREALIKLRNDGLVSILPRKGTFVSHITVQDVYEIYQIRKLVEPGVGITVKDEVEPGRLREFRDVFNRMSSEQELLRDWFRFDRTFHTYLVECTKNKMLLMLYERIMNHQQRISILAARQPRRLEDTANEHVAIIEALLEKDEERIREAITAHIMASWAASLRLEQIIR